MMVGNNKKTGDNKKTAEKRQGKRQFNN